MMVRKISLALAVLAAMMCLYAVHRVTAQDAQPLKVGVVDLKRFPEEYIRFKDKVTVLKAEVEKVKAELREMEENMKKLIERRALFDEGSDQWVELDKQINTIRMESAGKYNATKTQLEKQEKYYLEKLYADIRTGIDNYAKDNGFDFVFIQTGRELSGKNAEELTQLMYIKAVVYSDKQHDITDGVIKMMNNTVSTDGLE